MTPQLLAPLIKALGINPQELFAAVQNVAAIAQSIDARLARIEIATADTHRRMVRHEAALARLEPQELKEQEEHGSSAA